MNIKEVNTTTINDVKFYDYVECCVVFDLLPSKMRYCVPNKELVVEGGIEYISEDALWGNLYRQSKQYYKDLEIKKMMDTTAPLF